jgi:ubiquinone/menaquinone biosynthesis C-methylase UbiE
MSQSEVGSFDRIAAPYDRAMAPLEKLWLRRMRSQLVPDVRGQVLEIGVGTGANLLFYHASVSLTAVDESADMLTIAARRASVLDRGVHLSQASAERLSFPSGSFDAAIASLVLCSVADQERALNELWRVLRKPGGQLLLLEHMRPSLRPLAWLADLANAPWVALNGRCHLNRETQGATLNAGFQIERVEAKVGGLLRLIVAHTA